MRIPFPSTCRVLWIALLVGACQESPTTIDPQPRIAVSVMRAEYESVSDTIETPGSVQPRRHIVLSSQINGFVGDVMVKSGEHVRPGQILVTLDARDAESQKAGAEASLHEAEAAMAEARKSAQVAESMREAADASAELASQTFERYKKLFEARSVSPQELHEVRSRRDKTAAELAAKETMVAVADDRVRQIQARISQANAVVQRADVAVSWTIVKAPSVGRVVERLVDPGSAIFPGSPLLTVESLTNPQVVAEIPTAYADHLAIGLEVHVRMRGRNATEVTGFVSEISPLANPATHTIRFKVDLPSDIKAPSGNFVKVDVPIGARQVLLVPKHAVRERGQLTGIFIVDDSSTSRYRLVKIAPFDDDRLELLAGLDAGEIIITHLSNRISDGAALEIRP